MSVFRVTVIGFLYSLVLTALSLAASCPSPETVKKSLSRIWPRSSSRLRVERVTPLKEWPEFCEAQVSFGGPFRSFVYIHRNGRFAFAGQLLDLSKGENITRKRLLASGRINPFEILRLEGAVGYVWGTGKGRWAYFIMDPDCPHCKKLLSVLEKLVKKGLITLKVVYYPLTKIHPQAEKKAISLICEKRPPTVLLGNYLPGRFCEEGARRVRYARKVLRSLQIRAVPVLIRSDGRILKGAVGEMRLESFLLGRSSS